MIGVLLTILFFGAAIAVHEAGHFFVAKMSNIKVNEFAIGMGPSILHFKRGDTKYALRLFPIGGYVSMEGESEDSEDARSYNKAPVYKRMAVILAGTFMNFIFGMVLVGILLVVGGNVATTTISEVSPEVSSSYAVLHPGDRITEINGHNLLCVQDLQFELSQIPVDETIDITVKRDGETLIFENIGDISTDQEGVAHRKLGITLTSEPISVTNFIGQTVGNSLFYVKLVWQSLFDLLTGQVSLTQLSGPVGVTQAVSEAQRYGWLSVLSLFAFLSINIGVFNLIPFPALDGGQFIFLLIEAIRRKSINRELQATINIVGFGLLILLSIVITVKDVIFLF